MGPGLGHPGDRRYRVGLYKEALEAFRRADELGVASIKQRVPTSTAMRAMVHHRLGHPERAGNLLDELREVMTDDPVNGIANLDSLLIAREAEELIVPNG